MLPNQNLTTTQEKALATYRRLTERRGEPPTVREFAAALGKSRSAAFALIGQLREKGYLSMKPVTTIRPRLTAKAKRAQ
jgi:Mn-dependent DtxR family transcriptional regulator